MHGPEAFFYALTLLGNQVLFLPGQISDAILSFRPPLEPTGIVVGDIVLSAFPAAFAVGLDAGLRRRTQPAILFVLRVLRPICCGRALIPRSGPPGVYPMAKSLHEPPRATSFSLSISCCAAKPSNQVPGCFIHHFP
jgi:hypothetical protein